jgi:hypothetical protein
MSAYVTYHTSSLVGLGVCFLAPKKWASKIILTLLFYGLKINVIPFITKITDGLFTYYMMERMALGGTMNPR